MRPDGIGRCGSLMASTWRSNQSFTAWLLAQTMGPARAMPTTMIHQRPSAETPEATTPQAKAHIGGNQVIGFSSSATADSAGRAMSGILAPDTWNVNRNLHDRGVAAARLDAGRRCLLFGRCRGEVADVEAPQLQHRRPRRG